jgi:cell division septum initiation protein DivIVA
MSSTSRQKLSNNYSRYDVNNDVDLLKRIDELEKEVHTKTRKNNGSNLLIDSEIQTLKTKLKRMQRENDLLTEQSKAANGSMLETVRKQREQINTLKDEIASLERLRNENKIIDNRVIEEEFTLFDGKNSTSTLAFLFF